MAGSGSNPSSDKDAPFSSPSPHDAAVYRQRSHILIVEDNKADVFLIREAMAAAAVDAEMHIVPDGDKAIRYFAEADQHAAPCPMLVILDINLPKKHGGEVLAQMRKSHTCGGALVVVVTSSDSDLDRVQMARLGANEYFRKSSEYREYMRLGEVVRRLLGKVETPPPDASEL